jgi:hypothetical protein
METERKGTAAYLPFATFLSALDDLAKISIPNKIERATFPGKSGQDQTQVISAFRFFDLIADDGTPKTLLSDLAHNQDERKALMKQLVDTHYADIVALDFAKLTPTQLDQALSSPKYNIQGETKKKAKTFLLRAAQFAGYTVHQNLTKITRNRKKVTEKRSHSGKSNVGEQNGDTGARADTTPLRIPKPNGSERTVELKSGAGNVTLSLNVDLLGLDEGEDRDFVFDLIDKLRAYEKGLKASTEETNKVEKEAGE